MPTEKLGVLVLGSGGREHALFQEFYKSPLVGGVLVAPGNGGIPQCLRCSIDIMDFAAVLELARREGIGLIVPGPEALLCAGIVDYFAKHAPDIKVFGPNMAAAKVEGSKAFLKRICTAYDISTPDYRVVHTIYDASNVLHNWGVPIVIKADGLSSGKGVVVAKTESEAEEAIYKALTNNAFGHAGHTLVIERFVPGREVSVMAFCDGKGRAVLMPPVRDYKKAYDGDEGPNTGGMGAVCPVPDVGTALLERIRVEIIERLLDAMCFEGSPYQGVLYAGIMVTPEGEPKLLEGNVRFGDPEGQVLLSRLKSDLAEIMLACCEPGGLSKIEAPRWSDNATVGVVVVEEPYPQAANGGASFEKINGIPAARAAAGNVFFGSAFKSSDGTYLSGGGRVVTIVGEGKDIAEARERAYAGASLIECVGTRYRTDIAENM